MRKSVVEVGRGFTNKTHKIITPPNWEPTNPIPTRRIRPENEKRVLNNLVGWKKIFLPVVIFWLWWVRDKKS